MILLRSCLTGFAIGVWGMTVAVAASEAGSPGVMSKTVQLPVLKVKGDPLEDFGFRVSPVFDLSRSFKIMRVYTPVVDLVLPNTAASKAGIRPGDRIVLADGQPTGSTSRSLRVWERLQKKKWAEIATGKTNITWDLSVESVWAPGMRAGCNWNCRRRRHIGVQRSGRRRWIGCRW